VTSANTLVPGAITETKRSIWEVGRIEVRDYGPDFTLGTAIDNRLLFTQGVFVP
jgi:hypothetical protein